MDADSDGVLSKKEFVTFLGSTAHLDTFFKRADKDRSGDLSVELAGFIDSILKESPSGNPLPNESPFLNGDWRSGMVKDSKPMKTSGTDRLMVVLLCGIAFWGTAMIANANETKAGAIIKLWPQDVASKDHEGMGTPKPDRGDGHIRLTDVTTPSLRYFPAPGRKKPGPAVILCPGGGYVSLVTTKMTPIAEWLNDQGLSAFILIYRVPKKRKDAFQDIQRAVRIVRSRASEWNLDPERIGVMGSSAGGHLAARVSTGFEIQTYKEVDELDGVSCKPDFTVLLYPAYMNKGEALSKEFTVSNEISPTLIVSAKDDKGFFPGSPIYANALEEAGASVRVHFFEKGGHGFSLRPKEYPLSTWPDLCLEWFRDKGMIEEEAEQEKSSVSGSR